ncbi:metallophosphoesterase family protein [Croceicoccus marinus]|jgi:serine/threonine protein phosphatase 1|uniref:Serine/threonine protein phosphatase n=1 Tax=Croceicoccus marinus TaxID=450378 RepID=A0A7G6VT65_9SPHN|nr:metallophosphoesterase family protein [Croceicoccus marinus]QNE04930.1 serine/threonine protein phosphatase [Croceicoccus marinus]
MNFFRDILDRQRGEPLQGPSVPQGERVYAVGDVHGRLDLFENVIELIEADDAARGQADTTIILLGDLIDRGPDSAGVIARAREWAGMRNVRMLMGNHEEMMLRALDSDENLRHFLRVGGRETLLSYPIPLKVYRSASLSDLAKLAREAVPLADIEFIEGMEDMIRIGDYLFVHAGINPTIALEEQVGRDLRWIREPFLSHDAPLDVCVVHGHTIREEVEIGPRADRPNRIGIDTGAFRSGRLTAIGLEGRERWFIEASEKPGK